MTEQTNQPAAPAEDPQVLLTLRLSAVNYIVETLNRNPVGGQVMQVAGLITSISQQASDDLKRQDALKKMAESAEQQGKPAQEPARRIPTKPGVRRKS